MNSLFVRKKTFSELKKYLDNKSSTASFCFFRGRRRVGKSTMLELFAQKNPETVFYFMGRLDEKASKTLVRFTKAWSEFCGESNLIKYKSSELNWDLFFEALYLFGKSLKSNTCLVLDEIQWIAKEQSGFLGALKEHWVKLERIPKLKFILCGSSNKFFNQMTGGEEKLIRGLKTRTDIWLKPLTLNEIKEFYKPNFNDQELLLAYMIFGGIPYYWNQIKTELNFIQAINSVCFIPNSLFLEEFKEMLNLEFQINSIKTLQSLLEVIGGTGKTASSIASDSKLSHSTVGDLLVKLENYKIISHKEPLFGKVKEIKRGSLIYIKDFYLNFYFRVLRKYLGRIKRNSKHELIFAQLFEGSKQGLYIPDFTGPIFELLIQTILEENEVRTANIFEKLHLKNCDYEIGFHWDKEVQFDLILHKTTDRVTRFIECKWTKDNAQLLELIKSFELRVSKYAEKYQMVLCLNHIPSDSIIKVAKSSNITIVTPKDLI